MSNSVPIEAIMRALSQMPDGATASELAGKFGMVQNTISTRLSKLYLYGHLERERSARHVANRTCEYIYRVPR